ncbi:Efflux pump [Lachnellula occidentalis]|uniref:Efflux pump n=1 Tax=Lachnellula occidentalis TaxID=215460 RepID=A0A8H8UJ49_9HELO|nr:Efflux pump [Lachnellula occidentalis]
MADSEEPSRLRRSNTSGTTSRPHSPGLTRLVSRTHLDDHAAHHGHGYHDHNHDRADEESTDDTDVADEKDEDEAAGGLKQESSTDIEPEVRDGIEDQRDIEAGPKLQKEKSSRSRRSLRDANLVGWEGPDDPKNPKNWSIRRKWAATLVVSSFTFISPVSSSMVAPALGAISKEFNITNEVEQSLILSIFVLAYAVGPLFLGPLSEMYGRTIVLQGANLLYLFFNLGCGLAQTKGQMIAFRFLAGLGGSAPLAIGGGVLSDLFTAEQRGKAVSIYSLAPLLGPAIGPIAGGFVTENTTWRWVFYATTIADGFIQVIGLFYLQETYPPVLLHRKKQALIKETGNEALHTEYDHPDRTVMKALSISFGRPFKLLGTQVIVQVLALYMAYLYGLMYLVLSTFPTLWETEYHESIGIGGLNYISLGVGFFIGTQVCAPLQDRIYRALKKRNNGVGKPEFRVPLMIPGALLVPIGLFWYGWSAQAHTHWILPNIGAAIFAAGVITGFQCIQTYIVDSYTRYAASAVGAATVLRSLAGFGFPLFAPLKLRLVFFLAFQNHTSHLNQTHHSHPPSKPTRPISKYLTHQIQATKMSDETTPPDPHSLIPAFKFERILNQDQAGRRIILHGTLHTHPALLILERAPFPTSTSYLASLPATLSTLRNLGANDVYFWYLASSPSASASPASSSSANAGELSDLKINLIYPCTGQHVAKYSPQGVRMVTETAQVYREKVRPYMEEKREGGRLNWVYNIIEGKTEVEDVIFRTPLQATPNNEGFLLLPDLNWDRKTMNSLHLLGLVERRDLWSLRDLRKRHVGWLKLMRGRLVDAAVGCYGGVEEDQLKLYVHYQPTYYHFHIHVVHVAFEAGASQATGKAIGLESIIATLEAMEGVRKRGWRVWTCVIRWERRVSCGLVYLNLLRRRVVKFLNCNDEIIYPCTGWTVCPLPTISNAVYLLVQPHSAGFRYSGICATTDAVPQHPHAKASIIARRAFV